MVDADCLVAGILTPIGATTEILKLWRQGALEFVVCPQLLEEVRRTLLRPRIADRYGIGKLDADEFGASLSEEAILVPDPVDPPRVVPGDPDDDYLIALALASDAVLVTRDRHFDDVEVEGLRISTPGLFLRKIIDRD